MGDEEVKTLDRGNSLRSFVIKGSREMGLYLEDTESKDSLLV